MPSFNASTWRQHPQNATGYLYIHNPNTVLQCRINQATFSYPLAQLSIDNLTIGSASDTIAGMTIRVLDSTGITTKGYIRCRVQATSTIAYVGELSQGELDFADNDILQFLDDYRLWTKTPRITDAGFIYKDYDIPFTTPQFTQAPIANAGPYYIGFTSGGVITVDFDGNDSFAVAGGHSITGWSWDFGDGTPSSSSSAAVDNVSFPTGKRWVSLTVTDDQSPPQTHTARALVVAVDNSTIAPIPATVVRHTLSLRDGTSMDFLLHGPNLDTSVMPEGALVMYFEDAYYGSTHASLSGFADRERVKFVGYINSVPITVNPDTSDVQISCTGPQGILQKLPAYPQVVERSATPTSWLEQPLLTWWKMLVYILRWHSTVLELFDLVAPFHAAGGNVTRLEAIAGSLYDQAQDVAKAVASNFAADYQGRFWARRWPQLFSDALRPTLDTIIDLQDTDWTDSVQFNQVYRDEVGWLNGSGIQSSLSDTITPLLSVAPGNAPGQGVSQQNFDRQLIDDQAEMNQRTGDMYAYINRDIPSMTITILNQGQVVDPAWQNYVSFTLGTASNRRGVGFGTQDKWLLTQVDVSHDNISATSLERWTLEPVVNGVDGVTVPVPSDSTDTSVSDPPLQPYTPPQLFDPPNVVITDGTVETNLNGLALTWSNPLMRTFTRQAPIWETIHNPTNEEYRSVVPDEYSQKYVTGNGSANFYTLTDNPFGNGSGGLYYVQDAFGASPNISKRQNYNDYVLLRLVRGVSGGIAGYGNEVTIPADEYDVTFDAGGYANYAGVDDPGGATAGQGVSTGGNPDNCWRNVRAGFAYAWVEVDLGAEYTVLSVSADHSVWNAEAPDSYDFVISFYNNAHTILTGGLGITRGQNAWYNDVWSGSRTGCQFVRVTQNGRQDSRIDNILIAASGVGTVGAGVFYSPNQGVSVIELSVGGTCSTGGYDPDDFNLGVHVASAGQRLHNTTSYTGAFGQISGVETLTAPTEYNVIRTPFRRFGSTQPNNQVTALDVVWGSNALEGGRALWRGSLNASTHVMSGTANVTPVINGTTFRVADGNGEQLEILRSNPAVWAGAFTPSGGNGVYLLTTTNTGATWVNHGSYAYNFVRWAVPGNQALWVAGSLEGFGYSPDRFTTLEDRTGDYTGTTARGVFGIG